MHCHCFSGYISVMITVLSVDYQLKENIWKWEKSKCLSSYIFHFQWNSVKVYTVLHF